MLSLPEVDLAPLQAPLAVQVVALVAAQVRLLDCPLSIVVGVTLKVRTGAGTVGTGGGGAGAFTLTVID
ncbi:MAG: hypothetical protein AAB513_02975 [Patescibacteria group bacterium]